MNIEVAHDPVVHFGGDKEAYEAHKGHLLFDTYDLYSIFYLLLIFVCVAIDIMIWRRSAKAQKTKKKYE